MKQTRGFVFQQNVENKSGMSIVFVFTTFLYEEAIKKGKQKQAR